MNLKYHKIVSRKNSMAIRFFRCAIQATDSTFTGCKAKIMAAKNAPGMDNFRRMTQISSDSTTCKIKLVTWYPLGCIPHSRHSIQNVVLVAGQKSIGSVVHQNRKGPAESLMRLLSVIRSWSSQMNPPFKEGK